MNGSADYASARDGTFDGPEKNLLRTFMDARWAQATPGEGKLGLRADELRELKHTLA
jgi:hypothetical protein